jgi:asparagine synthase (glutamine-hydrolysing)
MCGISGMYAAHISEKHEHLIRSVMQNQFERGPDFQSMLHIQNATTHVLFGHNRLAIIDLSEQSNQPMWDSSGRFCIVYNGEIYNYLELRLELQKLGYYFNTKGDTEVILNAFAEWGANAFNRFQGPFALALFDKKTSELLLCRDRFGVKPLFYYINNNALYFASTSTVLAKELKLLPDLGYISQGLKYLVYEDNTSRTAYQNLFYLPGSHYLRVKLDLYGQLNQELKSYYHLEENVKNRIEHLAICKTEDLIDNITNKLNNAINIRLRADVPLAVSLSGGLDSSSIASLAHQQHPNIRAFSFSHPNQKNSEGPFVDSCAKFINIPVEYVWPCETEIIDAFFKTIEVQDAPFSSLSIVAQYLLYQKVRAANIKVLLGGQGGDEAFMGYKKFLLFSMQQSIKNKNYLSAIKKMVTLMPAVWAEIPSITSYWRHRHRYKSRSEENTVFKLPSSNILLLGNSTDGLWRRQILDIQQFSLPTLLRYEDRNSMSNSVESRLPFMDHHLIELALALPETMKLRNGYGKWIIRKIMLNKIPHNICMARFKRGFDVSLKHLISGKLGEQIRSKIKINSLLCNEFLREPNSFNKNFSDAALMVPKRFHEAIVLLWLNNSIS